MLHEAEPRKEWNGRVPLEQHLASCLEGHWINLLSEEEPPSETVKTSMSAHLEWAEAAGAGCSHKKKAKLLFLERHLLGHQP